MSYDFEFSYNYILDRNKVPPGQMKNVGYSTFLTNLLLNNPPCTTGDMSYCREVVTSYISQVYSVMKTKQTLSIENIMELSCNISLGGLDYTSTNIDRINSFINKSLLSTHMNRRNIQMTDKGLNIKGYSVSPHLISLILLLLDEHLGSLDKTNEGLITEVLLDKTRRFGDNEELNKELTAFYLYLVFSGDSRTVHYMNSNGDFSGPAELIHYKLFKHRSSFRAFHRQYSEYFTNIDDDMRLIIKESEYND